MYCVNGEFIDFLWAVLGLNMVSSVIDFLAAGNRRKPRHRQFVASAKLFAACRFGQINEPWTTFALPPVHAFQNEFVRLSVI